MSHDLFAAGVYDTRARVRQSSVLIVSVGLHMFAIAAAVVVTLLLPAVLPDPHSSIVYAVEGPRQVRLADIPLQSSAARPVRAAASIPIASSTPIDTSVPPTSDVVAAAGSTGDTGGVVDGPVSGGDLTGLVPGVTLEPPPSPSQSPAPVRLHAGIEPPRRVNDVAPSYPAIARSAGVRGIVIIEATIDTNGAVVAARILRSVPLLDEAALQAVRQWRYVPARLNGTPTAVLITVTVNFELAGR